MPKKKKKQNNNTGEYRGLPYDSNEELYFLFWAFELLDEGLITSITRGNSYLLSDSVNNNYVKQLKTKSKPMSQKIRDGHSYTPDFEIIWSDQSKVHWSIGSNEKFDRLKIVSQYDPVQEYYKSIIEIKPQFDFKNMERAARINIKWVWAKYTKFINIIKCPILFKNTFTPKKFLITKTGKKRKIDWKIKTLKQYINV